MKGIYLYSNSINLKSPTGIEKKVLAQIEALNNFELNCTMITATNTSSIFARILSRLPFTNLNPKWEYNDELDKADFIYIRKPPYCTGYFIHMLKKVKRNNPDVVIILEIPTYPYDQEFKEYNRYILLCKDRFNRRKYGKYIDRIVTFSGDRQIFGVQTIQTQNGIDVKSIHARRSGLRLNSEVHMLALAMFAPWHGYDRLLKGLKAYEEENNVVKVKIDFVGEGPALGNYMELASELGIEESVTFHGMLTGRELDDVFDNSDIAIASLGVHRIGLENVSTIKAREYCARGIPFVKAYEDADFDSNFEFALTIEASDEPADIKAIIEFSNKIKSKYTDAEIILKMREYAEDQLSWESKLYPVVEFIKNRKEK